MQMNQQPREKIFADALSIDRRAFVEIADNATAAGADDGAAIGASCSDGTPAQRLAAPESGSPTPSAAAGAAASLSTTLPATRAHAPELDQETCVQIIDSGSAARHGANSDCRLQNGRADQPLTAEQEMFCVEYARSGNGAAAYRAAFPLWAHRDSDTLSERARRLRRLPRIAARLAEIGGRPGATVDMRPTATVAINGTTTGASGFLGTPAHSLAAPHGSPPAPSSAALGICAPSPATPPATPALAGLVALAFDTTQPDVARLAALRMATDAALDASRQCGARVTVTVAITIEPPSSWLI